MTKTTCDLTLHILAAAHSTCVTEKWDQEKALKAVDSSCREYPDVAPKLHQSLCEAIKWMCRTKDNTSHEEMTDTLLDFYQRS